MVIGASSAEGFEPTGVEGVRGPDESSTENGYVNDLVDIESNHDVALDLHDLACPGEKIEYMLSGGDYCYSKPETQLTRAQSSLKALHGESGIVTIDLGFNDIRPCLHDFTVGQKCVARAITAVKKVLPTVLSKLKAAAGPHVAFVGIPYGDPFLSHYLAGATGPRLARFTLQAMESLDRALNQVYSNAHVDVANIVGEFKLRDTVLVRRPNGERVPENVAMACATTWMCREPPWGPDDHPNNRGYRMIAKSVFASLSRSET
jgi:lysophospholipase L1-like esterase